ncbi:MAG TPA: hypothetical protein VFA63_16540, partial [Pseudonocardiaceae bacterium]|nr:hypothetical protein [Pseudonocardiaceae bacterium]
PLDGSRPDQAEYEAIPAAAFTKVAPYLIGTAGTRSEEDRVFDLRQVRYRALAMTQCGARPRLLGGNAGNIVR